jgi:hypothetical protein
LRSMLLEACGLANVCYPRQTSENRGHEPHAAQST